MTGLNPSISNQALNPHFEGDAFGFASGHWSSRILIQCSMEPKALAFLLIPPQVHNCVAKFLASLLAKKTSKKLWATSRTNHQQVVAIPETLCAHWICQYKQAFCNTEGFDQKIASSESAKRGKRGTRSSQTALLTLHCDPAALIV
eukprot:2112949-Amphidinium_carterae.1